MQAWGNTPTVGEITPMGSQMPIRSKKAHGDQGAPQAPISPASKGRGAVQNQVFASLRQGLMSGLFLPGQVLSLRKLAGDLGTSPMPVRETLSRLISARALEEMPNRSVRVPRLTERGLVELFELRTLVEGMAARVACERVDDALIGRLAKINQALIAAHAAQKMDKVLEENQKFHFEIYETANSDILIPVIESLWLRCGPTMFHSFNSPRSLWDTSHHLELLEALQNRDRKRAQKAMVADIMKSGDYLIAEAARPQLTGPLARLERLATS